MRSMSFRPWGQQNSISEGSTANAARISISFLTCSKKRYSLQTVLAAGKQRGDTKQQHMLLKQLQGQKGIERTGKLRIETRML